MCWKFLMLCVNPCKIRRWVERENNGLDLILGDGVNPCKIRRWVESENFNGLDNDFSVSILVKFGDGLKARHCNSTQKKPTVSILVKFGDGLKDLYLFPFLLSLISVNPCKIRRWVESATDFANTCA